MSHHHLPIPGADQTVRQEFEDIIEIAAAAHYLDLHAQGRTNNGNLFSSVPPSDPAYVSGNLGGAVILHYVFLPILCVVLVPVLFGALLVWKYAADVGIAFGLSFHTARLITGIPVGIVWLGLSFKSLGWMFRKLF
jgi:hypothetical protein